jgi:hypothetical protein
MLPPIKLASVDGETVGAAEENAIRGDVGPPVHRG